MNLDEQVARKNGWVDYPTDSAWWHYDEDVYGPRIRKSEYKPTATPLQGHLVIALHGIATAPNSDGTWSAHAPGCEVVTGPTLLEAAMLAYCNQKPYVPD